MNSKELPKMERQTDIDIERLVSAINDSFCRMRCLFINEIGVIFANKEDGHEKAEPILLDLLGKDDEQEKFYAYCYLSFDQKRSKKVRGALKSFREKSEHRKIVYLARKKIKRVKEELLQVVTY